MTLLENDKLISLSSGMEATEKVEADLLSVEKDGKHEKDENFVKTTLIEQAETEFLCTSQKKQETDFRFTTKDS